LNTYKCSFGAVYSQRRGYPLARIKVKMILRIYIYKTGLFKKVVWRPFPGTLFYFANKSYTVCMEARTQKQLIAGLIFILILSGIGYGIYSILAPKISCTDRIKNGKEEGVDCGILACGKACEPAIMPINIISSQFFQIGPGDYDFVTQLSNPNVSYGASRLEYSLGSISGSSYILPGQTKWLVLTALKIPDGIQDVQLVIKNAQWEKLDMPDNTVNLTIRRKDYHSVQKGTQLDAVLYNDSNFDFDKIDVAVILFDDTGSIVGVNRTDIRTFLARSERGFNVVWPFVLPGPAVRQDVEASTNLFENSNFIKSYGSQEKFQKFY